MIRQTVIYALALTSLLSISCEDEYPYETPMCHCHDNGNVIGGWTEDTDTTDVSKEDTTGGFNVTVDTWGETEKSDFQL